MLSINNRDTRPIYEQLRENLKKLIISGVIAEDERLPSVRELAQQLAINPNTIQRAYRELEQEGWSYSIPGKGNFASPHGEVRQRRKQELLLQLADTAGELRALGVGEDELMAALRPAGAGG